MGDTTCSHLIDSQSLTSICLHDMSTPYVAIRYEHYAVCTGNFNYKMLSIK